MSEIKKDMDVYNAAADYALRKSCANCDRISELSFIAGAEWLKAHITHILVDSDLNDGEMLSINQKLLKLWNL